MSYEGLRGRNKKTRKKQRYRRRLKQINFQEAQQITTGAAAETTNVNLLSNQFKVTA